MRDLHKFFCPFKKEGRSLNIKKWEEERSLTRPPWRAIRHRRKREVAGKATVGRGACRHMRLGFFKNENERKVCLEERNRKMHFTSEILI